MNLELQQRAVEYNSIIKNYENLRDGLFEQMPAMEMKTNSTYSNGINCEDIQEDTMTEEEKHQLQLLQQQEAAKTLIDIFKDDPIETPTQPPSSVVLNSSNKSTNNDIFDLLNDDSSLPVTTQTATNDKKLATSSKNDLESIFTASSATTTFQSPVANYNKPVSNDIFDIFESTNTSSVTKDTKPQINTNGLDDLLGLSVPTSNSNSQLNKIATPNNSNDLFDFLSSETSNTVTHMNNGHKSDFKMNKIVGYDKNDLKITFERAKNNFGDQNFIQMTASNSSSSNIIREFLFGVAVPKSMQMQLSQPTTSVIEPLDSMNQMITIKNPNKVNILINVLKLNIINNNFEYIYINKRKK